MPILPFSVTPEQVKPFQPDPNQGPLWTRCQTAVVVALAAAEDHMAAAGVPRAEARIWTRSIIRTFLQNLSDKDFPAMRLHSTLEEFLNVCEHANRFNVRYDDDTDGGAA